MGVRADSEMKREMVGCIPSKIGSCSGVRRRRDLVWMSVSQFPFLCAELSRNGHLVAEEWLPAVHALFATLLPRELLALANMIPVVQFPIIRTRRRDVRKNDSVVVRNPKTTTKRNPRHFLRVLVVGHRPTHEKI